jgi:hypothetical protein
VFVDFHLWLGGLLLQPAALLNIILGRGSSSLFQTGRSIIVGLEFALGLSLQFGSFKKQRDLTSR